MTRALYFFLFVIAILLGPLLFWLFGPMLFWPLARKYLGAGDKRTGYFQSIFIGNLVLVVGGSLLVAILILTGVPDAIYLLAIPYGLGVIFLIAAIIVVFVGQDSEG